MAKVTLLTGGNLGDVSRNMSRVFALISNQLGDIKLASKIYESESWGFDSIDIFQNQVLVVYTDLDPLEVLSVTQNIEREFGKIVGAVEFDESGNRVYHSREMDIDILFYDDVVIDSDRLVIPHPRLHLRTFVLNPLSEVMGDFVHPILEMSINDIKYRYEKHSL